MAKILHTHNPVLDGDPRCPSVCLECELCHGRTWAWIDQAWTSCSRCGVRIYNMDGTWEEGKRREAPPE